MRDDLSLFVIVSKDDRFSAWSRVHSRSRQRSRRTEYLYVIQATNLEGVGVYSKGKLVRERGEDHFYFLISAKRALCRQNAKRNIFHFLLSILRQLRDSQNQREVERHLSRQDIYRNRARIFRVSQLSRKSLPSPCNAENTGKLPCVCQVPRRATRFLIRRDQENPQVINTN